MAEKFLYEDLDSFSKLGGLKKEIPNYLSGNLNPVFELRPYQVEAFARFFHCLDNDFPGKESPPSISCSIWRPEAAKPSSWRA